MYDPSHTCMPLYITHVHVAVLSDYITDICTDHIVLMHSVNLDSVNAHCGTCIYLTCTCACNTVDRDIFAGKYFACKIFA